MSLIAILAWAAVPACTLWVDGDRFREGDDPGDGTGAADATPGAGAEVDGSVDPGPQPEADAAPPDAGSEPAESDAAPAECTGSCAEGCDDGCCRETCEGGPGPDCQLLCDREDCSCALDCGATERTCDARCSGAACAIDCRGASRCHARCEREGDCTVDCTGAGRCDETECTGGASCLLDCGAGGGGGPGGQCRFKKCDGQEQSCPGGIEACNRDCP
ncbi:MAG TPA: hypothetical protein VKB80_08740 [Kofleriaceae bacterium]|nr:hypothetical protein [Kofleriaceae bacterium]